MVIRKRRLPRLPVWLVSQSIGIVSTGLLIAAGISPLIAVVGQIFGATIYWWFFGRDE